MPPPVPRVLVVDDENLLRWSLREELQRAGYQVDEAANAGAALECAARETPDLVLLDLALPDRSGVEVLRELRQSHPRVPVVMLTAHASIDGAVEALREGAYDYLAKPFDMEQVLRALKRAGETARMREELAQVRERAAREFDLAGVAASSAAMRDVVRMVGRVARSEASTILLLGESGVGKGLIARALHEQSGAHERPFQNITCTALTESLLESELFGHERGAFTDAKTHKRGLFELADGGTVFLDEIGDLSPNLQGKLLRFLEEKSFRRVGGTRDIKVAVRIIAATNKDLALEVEAGRFRRDLFYRLSVIPILIPPLRERREDIQALAAQFIARFNTEFHKSVRGLSEGAKQALAAHGWPGNVRELRNAIERAVLLAEGEWLEPRDLPLVVSRLAAPTAAPVSAAQTAATAPTSELAFDAFLLPSGGLVLEQLERHLLRQALERSHGNRTRAARLLGLNRDRIRYRIQKFGLEEFALGGN